MSYFEQAFSYTQDFEGWDKITNDPDDPGGLTKYGISKRSHPDVDIENLTEEEAKAIYKTDYWDPIKGDSIVNAALSIKLFDCAVNMGTHRAIKFFQEAANQMSCNLDEDGRMGPKTLSSLNSSDPDVFFLFLVPILEAYYTGLGKKKYLKGWLRRARTLPKVIE